MPGKFVMESNVDYELIDPISNRRLGFFRDNLYFEGGSGLLTGCIVDGKFILNGRVAGELDGNILKLGRGTPYMLELHLAGSS